MGSIRIMRTQISGELLLHRLAATSPLRSARGDWVPLSPLKLAMKTSSRGFLRIVCAHCFKKENGCALRQIQSRNVDCIGKRSQIISPNAICCSWHKPPQRPGDLQHICIPSMKKSVQIYEKVTSNKMLRPDL